MSDTQSLFSIDPKYCIDTNVIVSFMHLDDGEPYRRDAFPKQWELIERMITEGAIVAPERVEAELRGWEKEIPEMKQWLLKNSHMFREMTSEQLVLAKAVVNRYSDYGSSDNYIADLEVITYAGTAHVAVISNERVRPVVSIRGPKIPEVCAAFSIDCLSVSGFLRKVGTTESR